VEAFLQIPQTDGLGEEYIEPSMGESHWSQVKKISMIIIRKCASAWE
jgi:hypothetical protein